MKNKEIEELLNELKEVTNSKKLSSTYCITNKHWQLLFSYIEQLQKKIDQYENPDDLTLFYMWLDTKAKDKMKQLEKRNKELYEGFMATQEELSDYAMENEQLENNRDKAVEQCNDWIKIYKKINSDERLILRLEEISRTLKGDSDNE